MRCAVRLVCRVERLAIGIEGSGVAVGSGAGEGRDQGALGRRWRVQTFEACAFDLPAAVGPVPLCDA